MKIHEEAQKEHEAAELRKWPSWRVKKDSAAAAAAAAAPVGIEGVPWPIPHNLDQRICACCARLLS